MKGRGLLYGLVTGFILLVTMLTAFTVFLSSMNVNYTVTLDQKTQTFIEQEKSVMEPLQKDINSAYQSLLSIKGDNPVSFILGGTAIIGIVKSLLTSTPALLQTTATGIWNYLGLPDWLLTMVILIVTTVLVFSLVNWLYGRSRI